MARLTFVNRAISRRHIAENSFILTANGVQAVGDDWCANALSWFPVFAAREAIASRAVFVIVSRAGGRKRFWSQLNNSKTVRDRPYVSMRS